MTDLTMVLLVVSISLLASSGVLGLFLGRRSATGQRWAALLMLAGAGLGLWIAFRHLLRGDSGTLDLPWFLPWGSFRLKADALASFFLVPVFLIPALGSIYGLGYWNSSERPGSARALQFYYGILAASMAIVVLAGSSVLFLIAWEVMALSAYFLATADATDPPACKAGWMYLIGAHIGAVFLIALFSLMYRSTGSFAFEAIAPAALLPGVATILFVLALIGLGLKIGLMPLHLFLPGAPATGPSHVSSLLSGVVYKVGIYALIRVTGILPVPPAWWGGLLLFAGATSAILGVTFALAQNDLKRTLAYSSFENIGIISMGLGLALLGRTFAHADWIVLGLGGALFHSWNHALLKPLLFLAAGIVERAVGTTETNKLGGLAKSLPMTATLFIIGSAAICGLPPLNGFASEFLIYLGLFRTAGLTGNGGAGTWPLATMAVPCLALAGTLAVACFVNLSGSLFLGQSRQLLPTKSFQAPSASMTAPMIAMAALCVVLGLAPGAVLPLLDRAIAVWNPTTSSLGPSLSSLVPAAWISAAGAAIAGLIALTTVLYLRIVRRRTVGIAGTWDCGYARPSARMEYTASSFGHSLRELFRWALWPRVHRPQIAGPFAKPSHFKSYVQDPVLDRVTLPGAQLLGRAFAWLRLLQQGHLQVYVLYFFAIVVLLLIWGRSMR